MPFKSTAQQRFMFAQHPGIAHRWADEMKGAKRKGAKEHPIKSAHLPGHVGKSRGDRIAIGAGVLASGAYLGRQRHKRTQSRESLMSYTGTTNYRDAQQRLIDRDIARNSGAANVGKRFNGGHFEGGGSTIVRGAPRKTERAGKVGRWSGNGVRRGTRLLEEYHGGVSKGILEDAKMGLSMGRDVRPNMLIPTGTMKPATKAGKFLGEASVAPKATAIRTANAATSTPGRTAASLGGAAAVGGGLAGMYNPNKPQPVNKGPVWQPTSVAMNAQPIQPATPLSTTSAAVPPTSSAAGGQLKPGVLVPTGKPGQANVAGRAAGGQKAGTIRANGTMGQAATMGTVGATAAAQPTRTQPVTKADGTLLVRSHGPTHRHYDPESRRQRRLGQAQAATAIGGAASVGAGAHHIKTLNEKAKVTSRTGQSTGIKHVAAVSRRGAGFVGAGALGLAASNRIRRYANDPHNREWS